MKYLQEYRDPEAAGIFISAIQQMVDQPRAIMEICGGQTHSIIKHGIDQVLPPEITLIHGPGCPVCVTPVAVIDKAVEIAAQPGVLFTSFGDMLRVPGSSSDLFSVRASGGDVRMVYSPLDALKLARQHPDKEVVFFAVGFETTAPADALAVVQAKQEGIRNFSILVSHVLVPPAMEAILSAPQNTIEGFLAAGHVCAVMGYEEYEPIALKYQVPIVVTGFEPLDILQGIYMTLRQFREGRAEVENQYTRVVRREGNSHAREILRKVFTVGPQVWRGIGEIPNSGLVLREEYQEFDAQKRFGAIAPDGDHISSACISGLILQGVKKPNECPAFGKECVPERPLGAPMVSSEGACAAYYRYRRYEAT
ncbi:MAG: hydrogenase formation protein HypD [bacterium]|jgi:hydrogenase expression/formation protein HypD